MLRLDVVLLIANGDYVVGRWDLRSDFRDTTESWSCVLTKLEWAMLLWTITRSSQAFMQVNVKNEHLLGEANYDRDSNERHSESEESRDQVSTYGR